VEEFIVDVEGFSFFFPQKEGKSGGGIVDVEFAPEVYRYSMCGRVTIDSGIGMESVVQSFHFK
jgi:hypothetical protein